MLLTVSKRLEFSASRRLHVDRWSDDENLAVFGPETLDTITASRIARECERLLTEDTKNWAHAGHG